MKKISKYSFILFICSGIFFAFHPAEGNQTKLGKKKKDQPDTKSVGCVHLPLPDVVEDSGNSQSIAETISRHHALQQVLEDRAKKDDIIPTSTTDPNLLEEVFRNNDLVLEKIVLFNGRDIFSSLIKSVTKSRFSHSGLLFRSLTTGKKFIFESVGTFDEVMKGVYPHVRLSAWDNVIRDYEGHSIVVRNLMVDDLKFNPKESSIISTFIAENVGKRYEKNMLELIRSAFKHNKKSDLSTIFCSELVAALLMKLGHLVPSQANNYVPADFAEERGLTLHSAHLDPGALIKSN